MILENIIDETISSWMLNLHGNNIINHILKYITLLGEAGIIWIILLILFSIIHYVKYKKISIYLLSAGLALLIGWLINDYILKSLVQRPRPYLNQAAFGDTFKNFMQSISYKLPSGYSFPSGHSFSSFNCATSLFLYKKKYGLFSFPLALLIAFSRIFLGAHYFSDVLVGIVLGILFASSNYVIYTIINKKLIIKKEAK